jgi:hypothetical protein
MVPSKLLLLLASCLTFLASGQVQDTTTAQPVHKKRLYTLAIGSGVVYTGAIAALSELWYKDTEQQSFHFFNDNAEWKQVDKLGHFYAAFYTSYATANALQWCSVKQRKAYFAGAFTGFMVMLPIEVLDGFSQSYGASSGDLIANAGGAAFFLAQSLRWNEVRIYPKFSFHRTSYAGIRPNVLGANLTEEIFKDYNGQTHWLSVDMDKFIAFPKWLNIAVGYGAHNMVFARDRQNAINQYDAYRQYYLSIDFDLNAIKTKSRVLNSLIFIANMIKIPAPAVEFSRKGIRFHALYF